MGNNYKNIEIKIGDKVFYYAVLKDEPDVNAINIIKTFPEGIKENENETLIPQLWWGDKNSAKTIILAKNPSYLKNGKDDLDNKNFRDELINNLVYEDYNVPFDKLLALKKEENIFYAMQSWKKYFKGKNDYSNIAVFNMFGYYKTNLETDNIEMSHIFWNKTIKEDIINKILNNEYKVYLLWEGTKKIWERLLCINEDAKRQTEIKKRFKEIYALNHKNWRNPNFDNLKRYIKELEG